jgi:hypothetical protein
MSQLSFLWCLSVVLLYEGERHMEPRLKYHSSDLAAKFAKHINSAGAVVTQSILPRKSQLLCLVALINTYNRLNVITRQPGGDYQPGKWG